VWFKGGVRVWERNGSECANPNVHGWLPLKAIQGSGIEREVYEVCR